MLLLLLQVYPTAIRAFGMALCSAMSRIGGMTAPFIAQVYVVSYVLKPHTQILIHICECMYKACLMTLL